MNFIRKILIILDYIYIYIMLLVKSRNSKIYFDNVFFESMKGKIR